MASSLLALLDDIASLLDDVGTMTALAGRKTAGVVGDDLALNAQQVSGVRAERELPVVWAVARGSLLNKAVLVPAALAISAWLPWLVTWLLIVGGLYLCFEGAEKVAHRLHHRADPAADAARRRALADPEVDLAALERDKVRGAIRTDFVLSAEIIVIALGTVADRPLATRVAVLAGIALAMTVLVYGLVAAIVKLDDAGVLLLRRPEIAMQAMGRALLALAPRLMRALAVVGTAAMFSVGGGILAHGWPQLQRRLDAVVAHGPLRLLAEMALGLAAGLVLVATVAALRRLRPA